MKTLMLKPDIYNYDTAKEFAEDFMLGEGDLVVTNEYIYNPYFGGLNLKCDVIFQEKYGMGEPSDDMVEAMCRDIKGEHTRVIAIGGGTVLDISKLFALRQVSPVLDLYDGKIPPVKNKELILIPTTCGTGSEVTNISILALNSRGTKKGLAVDQMYAEHLLRPLESDCFALAEVPDAVLAEIFTLPRLKAVFPLMLRGLAWNTEQARALAQELRPAIPAVTETIGAGTLRLEIRIDGQHPGERPGAWYTTPRLHLLITGQDFVVPYGWEEFSELLGLFSLYTRHPEALAHGHQGERVMFSPPGHVTPEGFFGIDGLRIFLPADDFETLVQELVTRCGDDVLTDVLNGLRGLYGDL